MSTKDKIVLGIIAFIGIGSLIVGIVGVFIGSNEREHRIKACEEAGGTYFYHERKCLPIKEIKLQ